MVTQSYKIILIFHNTEHQHSNICVMKNLKLFQFNLFHSNSQRNGAWGTNIYIHVYIFTNVGIESEARVHYTLEGETIKKVQMFKEDRLIQKFPVWINRIYWVFFEVLE